MMYIVLILVIVHLVYWLYFFTKVNRRDRPPFFQTNLDQVTIVVCVKDGQSELDRILPLLQAQGVAEVIIVDDYSNPPLYVSHHPRTKLIRCTKDRPGKKQAILDGCREVRTKYVLFTDVDCEMNERWAEKMLTSLQDDSVATLGYGPMKKFSGLVATFARYETVLTAIQYIGYLRRGLPYMGVGRNMLVEASVALPILSDMVQMDLASGDDDLLIQGIVKQHKINVCLHPESFVYSMPKESLGAYIRQKSRHISTSIVYSLPHQILLFVFSFSQILCYIGLIGLAIFDGRAALLMLLVKWCIQIIVAYRIFPILREKDLIKWIPLLDIFHFIYLVLLSPYIFVKNNTTWS